MEANNLGQLLLIIAKITIIYNDKDRLKSIVFLTYEINIYFLNNLK